MVNKCVVFGCDNAASDKVSVFKCPNNLKPLWSRFVKRKRAKWASQLILICSEHFSKDSFENWMAHENGYQVKLKFKKGAVPTIYPVIKHEEHIAPVEQQSVGNSELSTDNREVNYEIQSSVRNAFRKREVHRVCYIFIILSKIKAQRYRYKYLPVHLFKNKSSFI